ncbi:MAG TPA: alpha/beta fold hydrolase, partial [Mycobacteriales bacterium]|nr:alpha/beta fold hydrolase [Mycobacteriales bacterium]
MRPRPRPGARATLVALLAVPLLAGVVLAPSASAADDVRTEDARVPSGSGADAVELDTTLYLPAGGGRAPAVVLAHGFGGSKDSVAGNARDLAERGYVVLTYSARGFGRSTGQIGLDDPRFEVADLSTLIDRLAERDDVQLDG